MLMLAGITIGGWVWFLSGDHATATELARRVTHLEDVQQLQADTMSRVLQSQARVEAMMEVIKDSLVHH